METQQKTNCTHEFSRQNLHLIITQRRQSQPKSLNISVFFVFFGTLFWGNPLLKTKRFLCKNDNAAKTVVKLSQICAVNVYFVGFRLVSLHSTLHGTRGLMVVAHILATYEELNKFLGSKRAKISYLQEKLQDNLLFMCSGGFR